MNAPTNPAELREVAAIFSEMKDIPWLGREYQPGSVAISLAAIALQWETTGANPFESLRQ